MTNKTARKNWPLRGGSSVTTPVIWRHRIAETLTTLAVRRAAPSRRKNMLPRRHNHRMQRIIEAFKTRDMSRVDVSELFFVDRRNAAHYLNLLHQEGESHIVSYLPYGIPVYRYGPGEDAKWKPKKRTKEQGREQKARAKLRQRMPQYLAVKSVVSFTLGV